MDFITTATELMALSSPYLLKIGDGALQKIGEDTWDFITKPFNNAEIEIANNYQSTPKNLELKSQLEKILIEKLSSDSNYLSSAQIKIEKLKKSGIRIITQNGEKSLYFENNSGTINIQ